MSVKYSLQRDRKSDVRKQEMRGVRDLPQSPYLLILFRVLKDAVELCFRSAGGQYILYRIHNSAKTDHINGTSEQSARARECGESISASRTRQYPGIALATCNCTSMHRQLRQRLLLSPTISEQQMSLTANKFFYVRR